MADVRHHSTEGSPRLRVIWIGRVHIARAPIGGIVIVPIHISAIASLHHIAMDKVRVVGWRTGDVLARLVDIDRVITDPRDRVHWEQKLRLPQTQEAPRGHLEKAYPPLLLIDEQVIDLAKFFTVPIDYLAVANV